MQVLTSCVASFSHGANDVSNAIGPFASVYYVWQNGQVTPANTPTPIWILAFGGIWICIGLATYGYNIMSVLGNRLTLHSPSRSFAISLGAAVTSLLAAQLGIPASTTMCIVGATAGVGIISSGFRSLNYRMFGWVVGEFRFCFLWWKAPPFAVFIPNEISGLIFSSWVDHHCTCCRLRLWHSVGVDHQRTAILESGRGSKNNITLTTTQCIFCNSHATIPFQFRASVSFLL